MGGENAAGAAVTGSRTRLLRLHRTTADYPLCCRVMSLTHDIARLLDRELDAFEREIGLCDGSGNLWAVVPGITNSAGTLALHVAGNLQHFIGAALGDSGYARNRAAEFSTRDLPAAAVQHELAATRAIVRRTLGALDAARLQEPMPGVPGDLTVRTEMFLLHLVAHTAFHLGQAGYIRRALSGDAVSARPLPLDALT